MLEPFLPTVRLLVAKLPKPSIIVTSSPIEGDKGNVNVTGRKSPNSLYDADLVTFEEGAIDYDHSDAHGFIRLNALRLRVNKMVQDK